MPLNQPFEKRNRKSKQKHTRQNKQRIKVSTTVQPMKKYKGSNPMVREHREQRALYFCPVCPAIEFAKRKVNISREDLRIITHCRKSLLFNAEVAWKKKDSANCFDVTMGSFDGAEVCELVGLYILSLLNNKYNYKDTGLYRDDGLIILRNLIGQQTDKARKTIINTFNNIGFKIDIQTNLKEVVF